MADIKLVIKLPEEEYNIIKNSKMPMTWAERLIANGTPLSNIKTVTNAEEAEEYPISEDISKGFEEFTNRYRFCGEMIKVTSRK